MNRTNAWLSAAAACCAVTASLCTSVDDRAATTTVISPQDPTPVAPRPATPRPTGLLGTPAFVPTDDADANDRVTPVVKAVRRAADSVVSIYVVHQDRAASRTRGGNVVDGQGSGVILDEKGLVISNWHVVALAEARAGVEIKVKLKSGKEYEAELLSTSPADDLALLQLRLPDGDVVKPVVLGNSAALEPGESVIAIGNPQGHANTVTVGVLSAQDREITVRTPDGRVNTYRGLLQTDAAINQGNSGGALLDITGKLIGINNAMAFGSENIGFAIPVDTVTRVFRDKLLSSENLARLWFGLRVQDEDGAPVIVEVDPDGPAHDAGLQRGDRLVGAGGQPMRNALDFARSILDARPGVRFPLRVQRGKRTIEAEPVPLALHEVEVLRRLGLELRAVTQREDRKLVEAATRAFFDGSGRRQLPILPFVYVIQGVRPGSSAAEIALERGDVMIGLWQQDMWGRSRQVQLPALERFGEELPGQTGREIGVLVLRDGKVLFGNLPVR